jgi:ParB family chromosome partitioning protein
MIKKLELISLDRIKDPERPLRTNLTPESVDELVFSIKEVGIIQPIVVCKNGEGFEVIAGHRRLFASEIAGLMEAPCIVVSSTGLDKEILKMHENIAREDINPIDWATHLEYLKKTYKLTNADMAKRLGFSEAWVFQHLEILSYPAEVLQAIQNGQLAFSAARELAQIKDNIKRQVYVNAAVKSGVTPAQAANWRREANTPNYEPPEVADPAGVGNGPIIPKLTLPFCAVCGEDIEYSDLLTLQIHRNCAPKDPEGSS